mgnify:CR=1 FL=1
MNRPPARNQAERSLLKCKGALTAALDSGVWLTFIMMALYASLLAQAWNILGGYGGQFSFGHALFFGAAGYGMDTALGCDIRIMGQSAKLAALVAYLRVAAPGARVRTRVELSLVSMLTLELSVRVFCPSLDWMLMPPMRSRNKTAAASVEPRMAPSSMPSR